MFILQKWFIKGKGIDEFGIIEVMKKEEKAVFAAGCFWGVEEAFRTLSGVIKTRVGYTGGDFDNPTYEDVCSHTTGHAEAVEITFDSSQITYENLVNKFFMIHDPTLDESRIYNNYRSAIFYNSPEQREVAEKIKDEFNNSEKYANRIATEIVPASDFWEAEDYHQQYVMKRGGGSCHV